MQKINYFNKLYKFTRFTNPRIPHLPFNFNTYLPLIEFRLFSNAAPVVGDSTTLIKGEVKPAAEFGPGKFDKHGEARFLEQVKLFFDRAANKTEVPEEYLEVIKACNTVIRFNIPLRKDNGKIETVTCYR
jgi:hypothetical protein